MKKIAILQLPYRGARDEFLPLRGNPSLNAQWVRPNEFDQIFPQGADIIILPGSAKTISDLQHLRESGGEHIIRRHVAAGGILMGICGGYQILGQTLFDPFKRQGSVQEVAGLGFLPHHTLFGPEMISTHTTAQCLLAPTNANGLKGEEHRSGYSWPVAGAQKKFQRLNDSVQRKPIERKLPPARHLLPGIVWAPGHEPNDGVVSYDRRLWGTYIHQVFHADGFCQAVLDNIQ